MKRMKKIKAIESQVISFGTTPSRVLAMKEGNMAGNIMIAVKRMMALSIRIDFLIGGITNFDEE